MQRTGVNDHSSRKRHKKQTKTQSENVIIVADTRTLKFGSKQICDTFLKQTVKPKGEKDVTVVTWNILAPMWVNKDEIRARGIIDMNLLNDDVRLAISMERILAQQPDILFLQEVQEDTYGLIKRYLSEVYFPVSFAPNIKEYWKSYLPKGQAYRLRYRGIFWTDRIGNSRQQDMTKVAVTEDDADLMDESHPLWQPKNGVATFYKRKTFALLAQKSFETSALGSIAQVAVLRRRQAARESRRIVAVNCHLEAAVSAQGALARIQQGTAIIAEAEKQMVAFNNSKLSNSEPVIIIAGDFNTQSPFPGYNNIKAQGFSSAPEILGKMAIPTFYHESPVMLPGPGNITVDSSAIDYVFIKNKDKETGKIGVLSAEAPTIDTYELTEKAYIRRLTKVLLKKLANAGRWRFWMTFKSPLFTTLMAVINDGKNSNQKANQVLRLGSDHLPVTVTVQLN